MCIRDSHNRHFDPVVRLRIGHVGFDAQRAAVDVGRRPQPGDVSLRNRFEPDRLPNPADRRVPDSAGGGRLLAARLLASLGRVPVSYTHLDVYKRQPSGNT